jgi:hypothetical protein
VLPLERQFCGVLDAQDEVTPFDKGFVPFHLQRCQQLEIRSEDCGQFRVVPSLCEKLAAQLA